VTDRSEIAEVASLLRPSLLRLVRVLRQQRAELSVTITHLSAMATLEKSGAMSAGELASYERVQPPSMSKVLATLEEAGYVRREPHPSDRRQAIIALTETGRDLLESERQMRDAWFSKQLARLGPDEVAALRSIIPLLDKLAEQ
jgi:DNA-binding MarR family transcriptional regulator